MRKRRRRLYNLFKKIWPQKANKKAAKAKRKETPPAPPEE